MAGWRIADLTLLAYDVGANGIGTNLLVGTIEGVRKIEGRGDRLGIIGAPNPDHQLIGQPDPFDNTSQNPISYGRIYLVDQ